MTNRHRIAALFMTLTQAGFSNEEVVILTMVESDEELAKEHKKKLRQAFLSPDEIAILEDIRALDFDVKLKHITDAFRTPVLESRKNLDLGYLPIMDEIEIRATFSNVELYHGDFRSALSGLGGVRIAPSVSPGERVNVARSVSTIKLPASVVDRIKGLGTQKGVAIKKPG